MAKSKKKPNTREQLREKTRELIKQKNSELSEEIVEKIENGIDSVSKDDNSYTVLVIKAIHNLSNDEILKNILENKWKPEDLVRLERESLNPEKWQKLQELRLPKNVKKERRKGTNKCPRCKSWYTTYKQAQTRSGDEGLTTRCYCEDCEYHWKFG